MTEEKLADWLRTAIKNSERKKYHDRSILTQKERDKNRQIREQAKYSLTGCPYCDYEY